MPATSAPKAPPATISELRSSGYPDRSVKDELRANLLSRLEKGDELFPGIVGYDQTVLPQVENAILSGHDLILLGERGQAKSRLIRSLVSLLDETMPVVAGCEINDHPYRPICVRCRTLMAQRGDEAPISWIGRETRYAEKLATPDITIADLVGEIDPIKVAEGKYLSDELTIHYGLVPRTNRGIFAINELPDLAERIQVGLLNLMEEKDVQIRGYKVRLPLDLYVVASANPEDYTSRGRIITPLKDRFGSQVRTHYPATAAEEMAIMSQEAGPWSARQVERPLATLPFMQEVVAELTQLARRNTHINQRSGVSVRMSIGNWENLLSNALRRAVRGGEVEVAPRISDLPALIASTQGKVEVESLDEGKEGQIFDRMLRAAVANVFNRYADPDDFADLLAHFEAGHSLEVSDSKPSSEYVLWLKEAGGLPAAAAVLGEARSEPEQAAVLEFILEGLHADKRLNKERLDATAGGSGGVLYHR